MENGQLPFGLQPGELVQEGPPAGHPEGGAAPVLSKKQQKRLLKQQSVEAHRLAKKAEKKALQKRRHEVKKASIEEMLAQMPEDKLKEWKEQQGQRVQERINAKQEHRAALLKAVESGQKVVIDLDFDGMMLDKELKSLMQQLTYSYSACTRGKAPCHLHLLGASGAVKERMQKQVSGLEHWVATIDDQRWQDFFKDRLGDLVYLTADAEDELQALNPNHTYIIGGLVDRNRYKSECFNRAKQAGIATARLPIGQYVKLATSQVITINQVVDILVGYQADGDWRKVLESVLPVRKVAPGEEHEGEEQPGADDAAEGAQAASGAAGGSGAAGTAVQEGAEAAGGSAEAGGSHASGGSTEADEGAQAAGGVNAASSSRAQGAAHAGGDIAGGSGTVGVAHGTAAEGAAGGSGAAGGCGAAGVSGAAVASGAAAVAQPAACGSAAAAQGADAGRSAGDGAEAVSGAAATGGRSSAPAADVTAASGQGQQTADASAPAVAGKADGALSGKRSDAVVVSGGNGAGDSAQASKRPRLDDSDAAALPAPKRQ